MKKHSKFLKKIMAVIISTAMIFTGISAGVFSVSASDAAFSAPIYDELENDCYCVDFYPWGVYSMLRPVDLTKGMYFRMPSLAEVEGAYLQIAFQTEPFAMVDTPENVNKFNSVTSDLRIKIMKWESALIASRRHESVSWDVGFSEFGKLTDTHFLQAVPMLTDGVVTSYQFFINGLPFAGEGGFSMTVDEFNLYNGYNSDAQSFDGAYINFACGPAQIFDVDIAITVDGGYTGSSNDTFACAKNNKGYEDVALAAGGFANSTWQADLKEGITFTISNLAGNNADALSLGFSNEYFAIRRANVSGTMNPIFTALNSNGTLVVYYLVGGNGGHLVFEGVNAIGEHTVKVMPVTEGEETVYKFFIDGYELSGAIMTEAEFNALNNEGKGAYHGFSATNGASISDIYKTVPTDEAFGGMSFNYEGTEAPYAVNLAPWGAAWSTWRADITKGVSFDLSNLQADESQWVSLSLCNNYWDMVEGRADFAAANRPILFFKNIGGKIYVGVARDAGGGHFHAMTTELSVEGTHILWANPKTVDGVTTYEFYIDDVLIDGGDTEYGGVFSMSEEDFNVVNNYNAANDSFRGSYLRFVSINGTRVEAIAEAEHPELEEEIKPGDFDNDGIISADDVVVLRKQLLEFILGSEEFDVALADINGDGDVNILDLVRIKKLMANS